MQPAGRIEDQGVTPGFLGSPSGSLADINRIHVNSRRVNRYIQLGAQFGQLIDGSGAIDIGRD